jgi:tetratricopeptide (TPR) repeat protein
MKKRLLIIWFAVCLLFFSCTSTGGSNVTQTADGLSWEEAIVQSASDITAKLPRETRVAIVAFDSENQNLSSFFMDELTGALVDGSLEVADRRNLAYVYKELNFQMSGDVSDEIAVSIGKFLGARYVITGQLVKAGGTYRYRLSGINVETAIQESSTRLNVRDDRVFRALLADIRETPVINVTQGYGEPIIPQQSTTPQTAGSFLDRGILFASRSEFDLAIDNYTATLRINPNYAIAYTNRGIAYSNKKMYDQAIEDYTAALRIDTNVALAYTGRGMAYANKEMYDRAIEDYTVALRIKPNDANVYTSRGMAYLNIRMYDRAIEDCTNALRIDPNHTYVISAYSSRGAAYYNKGDYQRAISDFMQTLGLDPNNIYAKQWLEEARKQVR